MKRLKATTTDAEVVPNGKEVETQDDHGKSISHQQNITRKNHTQSESPEERKMVFAAVTQDLSTVAEAKSTSEYSHWSGAIKDEYLAHIISEKWEIEG